MQQLLHLIIHSLYSNKEIFLRELISNASDACDRLRFAAITSKKLYAEDEQLGVWISVDKDARTITIRDNGIGMSQAEVMENIGTIARSGTRQFLEQMQKKDASSSAFIGQFGVGFYSAFLVAREVTVLTRKAGAQAADGVRWVSDGGGEYSVERITRKTRGSEIILQLGNEHKEFLEPPRLRAVLTKYCDHISLPIYMPADPTPAAEAKKAAADKTTPAAADKTAQEPKWETVNESSALWARPKNKIKPDEYNALYTSICYDPEPPALTLHNRVEGKLEYISLFYVPAKAPFDLWDRERRRGIKLYVRRIFIAEDARALLPNYLRFVRGLVDAADLPLNVSREFLQQNAAIDKIRAASVKKILSELQKTAAQDPEKYAALWKEYGRVLKEGVVEDAENRAAITDLLRFASTHAEDAAQNVSLAEYVKRMPNKQKAIYYVTADSHAAAGASPHLEIFRKNKIEVLLLSEAVDEWVVGHLHSHQDKPLQSIAKGDLDAAELADGETTAADDKQKEKLQPLLEKIKTALGERVKDVRASRRLVDSPACLVADHNELGANMERILQAIGQDAPATKPILEINPTHAIVMRMQTDDAAFAEWAHILFDHAALAEGATLKNPAEYLARINKLLARG